jgi:hypothetical protein
MVHKKILFSILTLFIGVILALIDRVNLFNMFLIYSGAFSTLLFKIQNYNSEQIRLANQQLFLKQEEITQLKAWKEIVLQITKGTVFGPFLTNYIKEKTK